MLEYTIYDTLHTVKPNSEQVYVHWGACISGKTRAARRGNAAKVRLHNVGKLAIPLHGYDYTKQSTKSNSCANCSLVIRPRNEVYTTPSESESIPSTLAG